MIHRIWSSLPTFREVILDNGFNAILADTAEDSKETESTNGLGKTTLIRIIHFCLGSDLSKDKALSHPGLNGTTFGLELQIDGAIVSVLRNTAKPKIVEISAHLTKFCPEEVIAFNGDLAEIPLESWKTLLSEKFFADTRNPSQTSSTPSFRELAAYLIRVGKAAYADPQLSYQGQPGPAKRLCLSYLLMLNWATQKSIQDRIKARSQMAEAAKAVQAAEETSGRKTLGEMEAERVALESLLRQKTKEAEAFNVRDDYRELEQRLGVLDRELHDTINENFSDKRLLEYYRASSSEDRSGAPTQPISIIEDARSIFKDEALRGIEEVEKFHSAVYRNRREFLDREIVRVTNQIQKRSISIDQLTSQKQNLLSTLKTSGAIETLIQLQKSFSEMRTNYDVLISKIDERRIFDRRADELTVEIANDRNALRADLEDRREFLDHIRATFAEFTESLYGMPGRLGIDVANSGYSFSFTIDRQGSDGVDQMVVFCFDLTVASLWAQRNAGTMVLIHDSTIFADVDPRQYAAALKLAAKCSAEYGFQYICCLNRGSIPTEHLDGFDLDAYVRLRLTDDRPEGGLLGMRLPPIEKISA